MLLGEMHVRNWEKYGDIFKRDNPEVTSEQIQIEYDRPNRAPLLLIVTTTIRIPYSQMGTDTIGSCSMQNILAAASALFIPQWLSEWPNYNEEVKKAFVYRRR